MVRPTCAEMVAIGRPIRLREFKIRSNWREYAAFVCLISGILISQTWQPVRADSAPKPKQLPRLGNLTLPAAPSSGRFASTTAEPAILPQGPGRTSPPAEQVQVKATTSQFVSTQPVWRPNSYPFGQCTYYVASRRPVPAGWGNARNWKYAAQRSGLSVNNLPSVGAIAWTSRGYYGHVAIVEQVQPGRVLISEMNYTGWGRVSQRWQPTYAFLYIH